jgi:hypothetical protein
MIRTKGRRNMERTSHERTSHEITLIRTKSVGSSKLKNNYTDVALHYINMVKCNAIGYHSIHKDWIIQQPLRIQLAHCHPLDREGYITKLTEEGVQF